MSMPMPASARVPACPLYQLSRDQLADLFADPATPVSVAAQARLEFDAKSDYVAGL